jgi:hypothetical protein
MPAACTVIRLAPQTISKYRNYRLTRRANHWRSAIIAKNLKEPARKPPRRAFCSSLFHQSDGGRTSRRVISSFCLRVGSEPPSELNPQRLDKVWTGESELVPSTRD